uniref:Uncharacterized protein n=1 Tax=Anguilla anguilla TaxID=7936 RepID=A0A0E9VFF9_ANGAN
MTFTLTALKYHSFLSTFTH